MLDCINATIPGMALQLESALTPGVYDRKLHAGELDVVLVEPHVVLNAERFGYRIFVQTGRPDRISGVIVVHRGAGIRQVRDLRKRTICLPLPDALASTMLVNMWLREASFNLDRQARVVYKGSDANALLTVCQREADVAAVSWDGWQLFAAANPEALAVLEPKWRTDTLSGPAVMAQKRVPAADVETLTRAFSGWSRARQGGPRCRRRDIRVFGPPAVRPMMTCGSSSVNTSLLRASSGFGSTPVIHRWLDRLHPRHTLRRQLIATITGVHMLLMVSFVYDLVDRQQQLLLERARTHVLYQAQVLAASSVPQLITRDLAGLTEIFGSVSRDKGIRFACLTGQDGRIISHSNSRQVLHFLDSELERKAMKEAKKAVVVSETADSIEAAAPVMVDGHLLGWAWIGADLSENQAQILALRRTGVIYTLIAVASGAVFAIILASAITRQFRLLMAGTSGWRRTASTSLYRWSPTTRWEWLPEAFNVAMDRLGKQRTELMSAHDALEAEVEVRRRTEQELIAANRAISMPTRACASSPTRPRTTCRSRCGRLPATRSCSGGATRGSSTRMPTCLSGSSIPVRCGWIT